MKYLNRQIQTGAIGESVKSTKEIKTIPPPSLSKEEEKFKNVEETKKRETDKLKERYAAKEKHRVETEIYGHVFYDWEAIMKEREEKWRKD